MKQFYCLLAMVAMMGIVNAQERDTIVDLPYFTSFEADQDTSWILANDNTNAWYIGSFVHNGAGSRSLYISSNGGNNNNYGEGNQISYAYRAFHLDAGEYAIGFDWRADGENNYDYLRAFLVPGDVNFSGGNFPSGYPYPYNFRNAVPEGWIDLASGQLRGSSLWQTHSTVVNPSVDSTYYLVFIWVNDNSGGSSPAGAIDNINIIPNTCPAPSNITLDSATSETLAFHWTRGGSETAWYVTIGDMTDLAFDTVYTAEYLDFNTPYTVSIRAFCDEGDTSVATSATFRTTCGVISSLPFSEDFEGFNSGSSAAFDPCWIKGNSGATYYPYVTPSTSGKCVYSRVTTTNSFCYFILPPLADDIDLNTLQINFDLHGGSSAMYSNAYVYVVAASDETDLTNGNVDTLGYATTQGTSWQNNYISLSGYTGTNRRLAFVMVRGDTYTENYIDNIVIDYLPVCERPTNLTLTGVSHDSLTLSWQGPVDAVSYTVLYRADDDTSWDTLSVYDTEATLANLLPSTSYHVQVISLCSATLRSDSVAATFRTLCQPVATLPWHEDFDSLASGYADQALGCWNQPTPRSATHNQVSVNDDNPYNGTLGLRFDRSAPSGCILALPAFDSATNGLELTFMHRPEGNNFFQCGTLKVGYLTDLTDTSTFVPLAQWSYNDFADNNYRQERVSFADAPAHAHMAFFHLTPSANNYYWYIDCIDVHPIPTCLQPGAITVGDVDTASIAFSFEGEENGSYAVWLTDGSVTVDSTIIASTAHTFASGLTPNTTYTIHVATACDGELSESVSATATTALVPVPLPYSTGFESGDDLQWAFLNGPNAWTIGQATGSNSASSLYVGTPSANAYLPNATSNSYAYKLFTVEDDEATYTFSFDWRCNGEEDYDFLRAFMVPASIPLTPNSSNGIGSTTQSAGWISLTPGQMEGQSSWQHVDTVLTLTAGTYRLLFYWVNDFSEGSNPAAAIDNLSILPYIPVCAAPTSLTVSDTTHTGATLTWTPGGDEASWQLTLGTLAPVVVDTPYYAAQGLSPETEYTVLLRAICGEGDTSLAASASFTTLPSPVLPCTPPTPAGLTTSATDSSAVLTWTAIEGYSYEVAIANGTWSDPDNGISASGNSFVFNNLTPATTYTLGVRALCTDGIGSAWATLAVTTDSAFAPQPDTVWHTVTLLAADDRTAIGGGIDWNVEPNTMACFLTGDGTYAHGTDVTITVEGFIDEFYTDRIVEGWYSASHTLISTLNPYTFTLTSDTTLIALIGHTTSEGIGNPDDASLSLYPNPASDRINIDGINGPATATLLAANGRTVLSQTLANPGSRTATLDVSALAPGAYFLRIVTPSATVTHKITIL